MPAFYTILRGLFLIAISTCVSYGQGLSSKLWRDSIAISTGNTFTNWLILRNSEDQPRALKLMVQMPASVQVLSSTPTVIRLLPGETGNIPLKGLLRLQPKLAEERVTVQLADSATGKVTTHICLLTIADESRAALSLMSPDESVVLYSAKELAHVPLRMIHRRLRAQPYLISMQSLPAGLDTRNFPMRIRLGAQEDTLLQLPISPQRTWSVNTQYQLVVTVRDTTGSIAGTLMYKLTIASTSKYFTSITPGLDGNYGASVGLTKLSSNQLAREGRVWGTDSLGSGQLAFQVHYLDYSGSSYRQLQNTYLTYRTAHAFVHLGTLYDYHEMPLLGRGLKVKLSQTNQQWTFWAVNTNSNWLDAYANTWAGNIASVRYERQFSALPNGEWSVSSSYFSQPGTLRAGYLNYATLRFTKPGGHSFEFLAGQSNEYSRQTTNTAQTPGWAGLVRYSYLQPNLRLELRSYLSTPAYAGLQRGATLINSQLAWQPANRTFLLLRLNHVRYNQLRFSESNAFYRTEFGNTVAEVNVSRRVGPVALTLRPYWLLQTDLSSPFSQQSTSRRIASTLNYRSRYGQQLSVIYDLGLVNSQPTATLVGQSNLLSQRITSTIGLGRFGLWGFWQRGPYSLYDFRSFDPASVVTASITPNVTFASLNQRLSGTVGLTYLKDGFYNRVQYIAVGRVQFDVTPSCWLKLEGNGTPYSEQIQYSYSQYRLEITKQFGLGRNRRTGRLQLSFFQDTNGNGRRDTDERWVDSLLVTINNQSLFTNARGSINYSNLPLDTYTVSAISTSAGRQASDPVQYFERITVDGVVHRIVPLRQTFRVTGHLRCQTDAYDRQPCDFERFVVEVQQDKQRQSVAGLLPDGSFTIHLSPGDYTLLLHDKARPLQPIVKTVPFKVSGNGQYPAIDWQVNGSLRSVEVKRFKAQ